MPDRKDLDRPATTILAVSGLLFMAASIPFLPALYCKSPAASCTSPTGGPTVYDVSWGELQGSPALASLNAPGDAQAKVTVAAALTSQIHVLLAGGDCKDQYNPTLQQNPAQLSWSLTFKGQPVSASAAPQPCSALQSGFDVNVTGGGHADLAQTAASNDTAAQQAVANATADRVQDGDYVLTVHVERAPSPVPVIPGTPGQITPTFSIKMGLRVDEYRAVVTKHVEPEVGR